MTDIFVSYRRSDSSATVGRIFDRLEAKFGREHVFRDLDSIGYGQKFGNVISQALTECEVVLVIIGNNWIDVTDSAGGRRLEDPDDWVRFEVSKALEKEVFVIPVLIDNAVMPQENQLPENIKSLVSHTAATVRDDPDFNGDIDRLLTTLKTQLPKTLNRKKGYLSKKIMLTVSTVVLLVGVGLMVPHLNFLNTFDLARNEADNSLSGENAIPSVFFRGTANNWAATPMTLVADHLWEITASFEIATGASFKFDVHGDWRESFGDSDGDGVADRNGRDIPIGEGTGMYRIEFNDQTKVYTVKKQTKLDTRIK